jgi:dipeptidyl aminopeptidase/acylaminoacyl peptidase
VVTVALLGGLLAVGCSDSDRDPVGPNGGVDFDRLFAAPTAMEVLAVSAEWSTRDFSAVGVAEEASGSFFLGSSPATLTVLSHDVGGVLHYGAVIVPDGAPPGSLPVLVYAHASDDGVDGQEVGLVATALGSLADDFVYVVPSFRSETLRVLGSTWRSEGDPSPWDQDVDDALALLSAAIEHTAEADPDRVAVVGLSRGAGVALLMGIRDERVDLVVDFFGPTDFFDPWVRGLAQDALSGRAANLPGFATLHARFLRPLENGSLAVDDVRLELLRRSPTHFADRLPSVQVHHGTADQVVPVSQAERLIAAVEGLGRGPPADEWFLYQGGGHNPLTLSGSFERSADFLDRLRTAAAGLSR